jgi:hypothetical protein
MAMIIRIQINHKEIRCYAVQRITNTVETKPYGKVSTYQITDILTKKSYGTVRHKYDDNPEKLVIKAMKKIR